MILARLRTLALGLVDLLPPRLTRPLYYWWRSGRWPENPPRSFSGKTQAAKLRPVTPQMVQLADKVAVKEIVRQRLGPDWVVPTLYAGEALPLVADRNWPVPFVIKPSHGSGWNIFVRRQPDWTAIERRLAQYLTIKPYRFRGEMHYRSISPRVIVEPMIAGEIVPPDYKVFVLGGAAHFIQVDTRRYADHRRTFYGRDWERLPFTRGYPAEPAELPRPPNLARILDAAERMAAGFDFLRVDFYDVGGRPYFGEATFFPDSGIFFFDPPEYERIYGEAWPWQADADARH